MTQEALRMALEAMEENHHLIEEHERPEYLVHYDQIISLLAKALAKEKALQALHSENERLGLYKDAYAQPEQEPVAWMWDVNNGAGYSSKGIGFYQTDIPFAKHTPLYTTPPQRTWVGLTDEEIQECYSEAYKIVQGRQLEIAFYKTIEAKLKEKNGFTEENT